MMIGTMSPDFAYVLNGSRLNIWAHSFPSVVLFCVPVTLLVSWLVCNPIARVVPSHLPNLGRFNLHEYRGLAAHQFRWPVAAMSALAGALSHVFLDMFTHDWGWFAQNLEWYRAEIVHGGMFGRRVTFYRAIQHLGHVVFSGLAISLLARYGSQHWMARQAAAVPQMIPTRSSKIKLWVPVVVALILAVIWVGPLDIVSATSTLRLSAAAFTGLLVGSVRVQRSK